MHYVLPSTFNEKVGIPVGGTRRIKPPIFVTLPDKTRVAQWADTEKSRVDGFRPDVDCQGNFTASKFQANNNCYNYACNIATNSFALPGRRHGKHYWDGNGQLTPESVRAAAEADGLITLGDAQMPLASAVQQIKLMELGDGHLVALLISSQNEKIKWLGDFHFVRCDDREAGRWSQKNGPDQVTNFDFEGKLLVDPSKACWVVNQGPHTPIGKTAIESVYFFSAWMYVPFNKVDII